MAAILHPCPAVAVMLLTLATSPALAQLTSLPNPPTPFLQQPPRCITPQFWCWAQPPGPPGSPCFCPTPYGPVRGTIVY